MQVKHIMVLKDVNNMTKLNVIQIYHSINNATLITRSQRGFVCYVPTLLKEWNVYFKQYMW